MAATGIVSGINGRMTFTTGYATKVTAWTLNIDVAIVDTTALGDTWRSRIAGLKEWSGTATAIINSSVAGSLTDLGIGEAPAVASFVFDDNSGTDGTFHGSIIIGKCAVNVGVGDQASTFTFDFFGSSTLTLVAAA